MTNKMTAREENIANQLNDSVNMAINKVMGQDSQSYEDFIGGFQHITRETALLKKKCADTCPGIKTRLDITPCSNGKDQKQVQTSSQSLPDKQEHNCQLLSQDPEEELEEEMLENGITATSTHTPRVKVDNFVDDEDIENSGYIASFSGDSTENNTEIEEKEIPMDRLCDTTDNSAIETQTDFSKSNNTGEDFKSTNNIEVEEPDSVSEVVVEHKSLKDQQVPNPDSGQSLDDDLVIEQINVGTQHMTLYPGEADIQEVPTGVITNHTQLDFTTTILEYVPSNVLVSSESSTDEVQPFTLDLDFDYDNVTLTPKFTMQEMEHLKSFLP